MNRRIFLGQMAGTAGVVALANPSNALAAGLTAQANGYNVLFVAVDDLRPELGCYGKSNIHSPNFDRLAQEGVLFERTYCQAAICMATRASLLSGCRPNTTKVYEGGSLQSRRPGVLTLPKHFKANGYQTVSIGKVFHYWETDCLDSWSKSPYSPGKVPWVNSDARTWLAANPGKDYLPYESANVADNAYEDGASASYAIQEMNRLKDKKFFLAVGFLRPHLPFCAPKRYWDLYNPSEISLADNPYPAQDSNQYTYGPWGELRQYLNVPKSGPIDAVLARKLRHGYYASISYSDAQLGRLLAELDRLNLRQKTVVIIWGDNGWKLGEHAAWCKHGNVELDTHVPMIISVPGITGGKRVPALTEFVDIYPSLADICGLTIPAHLEGTSFKPLLSNPTRNWKSAAFSQYIRRTTPEIMGYSMRTNRYRYTEWQVFSTGAVRARELYDHQNDPKENVNIAGLRANANLVSTLSAKLRAGWRDARPTGV